jgi:hypothetical protein
MSKYYQNIQNLYKLKYNKNYYYKSLVKRIYAYKYNICINIYELDLKLLKEIKRNSYFLDVPQYIFSSTVFKKIFLKTPFYGLNGHILMYVTNNKDLFFLILKKINLYYFICYEKYLFYYKEEKDQNFLSLYNEYNNNYYYIHIIISNVYLIYLYIFIYNLILKIILII